MGTTLNGTTPSATYTGLLKFGDNTEITSSLKAISDGAGNDTMLELSTTALQIGGSTGAFWDDTNKRLGIGTNTPNSLLNVIGSGSVSGIRVNTFGADSWMPFSDGNWYIRSNGTIINDNSNAGVSIGVNSPTTARLLVKGSGSTSATISFLVQNSAGTQLFKINDNRDVFLGSSTNYIHQGSFFQGDYYGVGNWNFGTASNLGARLGIKGSGNTSATTALLVQNSDGDDMLKVTDDSEVTLSKLVTIRNSSAGLFARAYADGYGAGGALMWVNGSMNLGSSPSTAAKLSIKGSGATSATTALLVQNSAGTALLTIKDDGVATFGSALVANNFTGSIRTDFINTSNNFYTVLQTNPANGNGKFYESVSIGTSADPVASAKLELVSTTKGFLPPRMTTTQKNAISSPASGLQVYDTTLNQMSYYNGTSWVNF